MSTLTIISRKEAREQGLRFYFTGKPCVNGRLARRYTSVGNCEACNREWLAAHPDSQRDYRRRNAAALKAAQAKRYAANRVAIRAQQMEYISTPARREASRQRAAKWYAENKARALAVNREWQERNRAKVRAVKSKHKAKRRERIPSFYDEFDEFVMREAGDLVLRREALLGGRWHIDHTIPLCGRRVSGLHVAENIAVIPESVNAAKQNRAIYTTPGSWLQGV